MKRVEQEWKVLEECADSRKYDYYESYLKGLKPEG